MTEIARTSGVAKATLYNHFRTKDDVLGVVLEMRLASPQLRRIAADDQTLLTQWCAPGAGQQWNVARTGIAALLANTGSDCSASAVDVVLRWLLGHLAWKGTPAEVALGARLLASGLAGAQLPAPNSRRAAGLPQPSAAARRW